jgi:hypothetical protein
MPAAFEFQAVIEQYTKREIVLILSIVKKTKPLFFYDKIK